MKITKEELSTIFACYHAWLDEACANTKFARDVFGAFQAGTLEIEGYESAKWHKFDPDDESTFPPNRDKDYLICHNYFGKTHFMVDVFCLGLWKFHRSVIAWRELPQKPKF